MKGMSTLDCHSRYVQRLSAVLLTVMLFLSPTVAAQTGDTACAPRQLPWATSFDEDGFSMQCWTVVYNTGSPLAVVSYSYPSTGVGSLDVNARNTGERILFATPLMAYRADSLHISFMLTQLSVDGLLEVGLIADTTDSSTFTPMLILPLATTALGYYEFYTDGYTSTDSVAVAFRLSSGRVEIDDLSVEVATNCRRPRLPLFSNITTTGGTVSWTSNGGTSSYYVVRMINTATADTFYLTSHSTSITVEGLDAGTSYQVAIATLCGLDTTAWLEAGLLTTDVACRQPIEVTVEGLSSTAAAISWAYDTNGHAAPTAMQLTVSDLTTNAAPRTLPSTTATHAFVEGLTAGHHYSLALRTICTIDTAMPLTLTIVPLADACTEHRGQGLSGNVPLTSQMPYSYCQMLYPKNILVGMDSLHAMSLRVISNNMYYPRRLDIYIGQTADTHLTANQSTLLATQVANDITFNPATGWITIPFSAPLHADTSRNLVVTVVDHTSYSTGPLNFGTHSEAYGNALYASSAYQSFDPTAFDLPLTSSNQVADIQLFGNCQSTACPPPTAMVTASTSASITLEWVGAASGAAVRYRPEGASQWASAAASTSPCVVSGLNASTRYELQVGAICSGDTVFGQTLRASTACGIVTVPYLTDFSTIGNPCWHGEQLVTGGGIRLTGTIVSPEINAVASTLQVRVVATAYSDGTELLVGVGNADGSTVSWADTLHLTDRYGEEMMAYLDGYSGNNHHIVLSCADGCRLQLVSIEPLDDCLPPHHLIISNTGADHATFSWRGSTDATYEIHINVAGTDASSTWQTSANQITVTGLAPSTDYEGYAVSRCAGGSTTSVAVPFAFSTSCGAIRYFPYEEGFEAVDQDAWCWTVAYADPANRRTNPAGITGEQHHSGRHSFRFASYNFLQSEAYTQYLISPRIVADDSIWVSFWCRKENMALEPFAVGFSTSGNATQDFLWMTPAEPTMGTWTRYEVGFPAATRYIAIKYMAPQNYYLYIDDLTITGPGCSSPTITSIDEQTNHISMEWQAEGDTSYVAITDGLWLSDVAGTAVTDSSYTFGNLPSGRFYTIGVRSRCPDGHLSDWTTRQVVTISPECTPPTSLSVGSISYTSADLFWAPAGGEQGWQICVMSDDGLLWTSPVLTETECTVTGLEQGREYSILVRSLCSNIPGPWSDTLTISTTECQPINSLAYTRVDFRTIDLSWEDAPVTIGRCRIEYGPEGFTRGAGNVVEATGTSHRLSNLDPYANYDIYVQNYCQPDVLSPTAAYIYVPTGVGIDAVMAADLEIYPNPATGMVTIDGYAGHGTVTLVDITGRIIATSAGHSPQQLDVSPLPSGTYFVRVTGSDGTAVGKLLVR